MKIQSIEFFPRTFTLATPYRVAYSRFDRVDQVFLKIDTGIHCGWGCMAPDPSVTGEYLNEIAPAAESLLPHLLKGTDPFRQAKIMDRVKKTFPGWFSLWAAVDMALWDLVGKHSGLPAWKLLGGYRSRIETSITVGICPLQETLERSREYLAEGFRILKIKGGLSVEEDLEKLFRLREELGREVRLRFDANQGYTTSESLRFIRQARPLGLELIEQPTRKGEPEQLGEITDKSGIPVMADESLVSLMDAFKLARKGLVDMMNIKIQKVGGITEAVQVDSVARSAHIKVMVGCMDESALGIAAGLCFALSRKNILYADLDGHLDIMDDPAAGCVILKYGYLYPSNRPGLGWEGL